MPKLWIGAGIVRPQNNNLEEGDVNIVLSGGIYGLQVRQSGAWVDVSPRLSVNTKVQPTYIPGPYTYADISLTTFEVRQSTVLSDVPNSGDNVLENTTLAFSVTENLLYRFRAEIVYSAAATTTGSRWVVDGPSVSLIAYRSVWGLTTTSESVVLANDYNLPAACNASSPATTGNLAIVEGILKASATGTVNIKFASEVSGSAITVKAGSVIHAEGYTTVV